MRKRLLLLGLLVIGLCSAKAQEYKGYFDVSVGSAYNFNTAQLISTNNLQLFGGISTSHGISIKNWFVGIGVGYYHSFRDHENMFPFFISGRYSFTNTQWKPFIGIRAGFLYDPYWIEKVQKIVSLGVGINVYKGIQVGLRMSLFSRPSRFFTANALFVITYAFGE